MVGDVGGGGGGGGGLGNGGMGGDWLGRNGHPQHNLILYTTQ